MLLQIGADRANQLLVDSESMRKRFVNELKVKFVSVATITPNDLFEQYLSMTEVFIQNSVHYYTQEIKTQLVPLFFFFFLLPFFLFFWYLF